MRHNTIFGRLRRKGWEAQVRKLVAPALREPSVGTSSARAVAPALVEFAPASTRARPDRQRGKCPRCSGWNRPLRVLSGVQEGGLRGLRLRRPPATTTSRPHVCRCCLDQGCQVLERA
eukprot:scaffold4958_cov406-Prasinococcus_capsulatus_cf.AAC.17